MRAESSIFRPHFALVAALALLGVAGPAWAGDARTLVARAREARLWADPYWVLLNHYQRGLRGFRSEIRSPDFFLAPDGRDNPQAELEAALAAFAAPAGDDPDRHAQCRFPARYLWLKERLAFDAASLKELDCPRLKEWEGYLNADSASLIFASAYLDNPSSMYGHTFLLLNQKEHGEKERILDYVINFAAVPNTKNGILFAVDGMFGVFPGRFSAMPYYMKVQEYSNLESRDLWEYRLSLGKDEIRRMILHLWELGGADFSYYFFNKNCSYQLLELLDTARPSLRLSAHWPLYVIPFDTVRDALAKGLVADRTYRPSSVSRMLHQRALLGPQEARLAGTLALDAPDSWRELKTLPPQQQAWTLDSAMNYLQYRVDYRRDRGQAAADLQKRLLHARSDIPIATPPEAVPPPPPPESGHLSLRGTVGYAYERDPLLDVAIRPALHDLVDPPDGYAEGSRLEMLDTDLRYDIRSRRAFLQSLDLVDIVSMAPLDPWIRKPSWMADAGFRQASELDPAPGRAGYFGGSVGTGLSIETHWLRRELGYALVEADAGAGGVFRRDFRIGAGPSVGLLFQSAPRWRSSVEGTYMAYALGDTRSHLRVRLETQLELTRNLAVRATLQRFGDDKLISAGLLGYF